MRKIEFAEFELDLDSMSLSRNGKPVSIGKKTCDALLYLIQNKDRFISREELHRQIWGSSKLSPSTIPMCIVEIRKSLLDDSTSPTLISSRRRHGYRFIGNASITSTESSGREAGRDFQFTGRETIIASLELAARSTLTDLRGRTITIIGEAGSGKTRLVSEFALRASGRTDILISRAISSDTECPYSIWTSALRAAADRHPENLQLKETAHRIASLFPELLNKHSNQNGPALHDQRAFLIEWSTAFKSIVSQRPLILILEDIHHADIDSLKLLERVSAEIASVPIIMIATMRPLPSNRLQMSSTARTLAGTDSTLLAIPPLRVSDIEVFIDEFLPERRTTAERIFLQTAGNAFFATYLANLVRRGEYPRHHESSLALMQRDAKEIVAKHLSDLSDSCRRALETAASIGTTFSPKIASAALGNEIGTVMSLLDSAERAQIISCTGQTFEFRHSILRDLIYASIDKSERSRIHLRIAETIGSVGSENETESIVRFDHLLQAYPLSSAEKICNAGILAATDAASRFAHSEACRILTAAIRVASDDDKTPAEVRCDAMIKLARCMLHAGDRPGSRETLLLAASLARKIDDPSRLAQCGLDLAPDFLAIEVGTYDVELIAILRESLTALPKDLVGLRSRVLSRLSQALRWSGEDIESIESLASEALRLAEASHDLAAQTSALAALSDASIGPDLTDQRISRIMDLQRATLSQSDRFAFLTQQTRLIAALLEKGDFRRLRLENERHRSASDVTGLRQYMWYPVATDSMLACATGRIDVADIHAQKYAEIAGQEADENFRQTYACQYALRAIERDHSEQILSTVEQFANSHRSVLSWSAAVAWIQWDCGKLNAARETLRQFSRSDIIHLYREPGGTIGLAALAETAAHVGDRAIAQFLYELIAPVSSRFATAGYGVAYFGSLERYASSLATALKLSEQAMRHASAAVKAEERLGTPSWLILAQVELSRAMQTRGKWTEKAHTRYYIPAGLNLPRAARILRENSLAEPPSF